MKLTSINKTVFVLSATLVLGSSAFSGTSDARQSVRMFTEREYKEITKSKHKEALLSLRPEKAADIEYFFSLDPKKRVELLKNKEDWVVGLVAGVVFVAGALAGQGQQGQNHQNNRPLTASDLDLPMVGADGRHVLDY